MKNEALKHAFCTDGVAQNGRSQPVHILSRLFYFLLLSLCLVIPRHAKAAGVTFLNSAPITISDNNRATPYPSVISVSGVVGTITRVTVTLFDLSHTRPSDVDVVLVSPWGQSVGLMGQAGGANPVSHVNLTFDDSAASAIPFGSQISSGTYRPVDYTVNNLPSPAPSAPYGAALGNLNNRIANGNWQLFVADNATGEIGQIGGGWQLTIYPSVYITSVCPIPVKAPSSAGQTFTGTFVVTGSGFTGSDLVTDNAPLGFVGPARVNADGTAIARDYVIGCCAPQEGQTFNVFVNTPFGGVSAPDSITLAGPGGGPCPQFPSISPVPNQVTPQNTPLTVSFTVSDAETPAANLTVSATSSNQALVPDSNLAPGGSGANRTLQITPALNASGLCTIVVTVRDADNMAARATFQLTVGNSPPTISFIPNQTTLEDTPLTVPFVVSDLETPADSLILSATSSNPALIPDANLVFGGTGNNRTLTLTPAANVFGTASVTVRVRDQAGTNTSSFQVTVNAVNDPPTISAIPNQTIIQDQATGLIPFTVNDLEDAPGALGIAANSSNQSVVPDFNIALGGAGGSRTIQVTPAPGVTGMAAISVAITDSSGARSTRAFSVTVTPPPTVWYPLLAPGWPIVGVAANPGDSVSTIASAGTEQNSNNFPAEESPDKGIDGDLNTKYLNRGKTGVGLIVTLQDGAASASGIRFATANDLNARDPLAITIEGTSSSDPTAAANGATWTLIYSGTSGLDQDPGRLTQGPIVWFPSSGSFKTYRILVTGVRDPVAANSMQFSEVQLFAFNSPSIVGGGLRRELFLNVPGGGIGNLTSSANYPDAPDSVTLISAAETPSNVGDEYGQRLRGFILPPVSGDYVFYVSSDDQSEVFLSTDASEINKILIASEPQWNGPRQWITGDNQVPRGNPPSNISSPVPLQAGQVYYFEVLYKEGGGGDNLGVTWQIPGSPSPVNGDAPIPGQYLAYDRLLSPPIQLPPPTIQRQPQSRTVLESQSVSFSVVPNGSGPFSYQWYRDTVEISGATANTYTLSPASLTDSGAVFTVRVSNPDGNVLSGGAILTVKQGVFVQGGLRREVWLSVPGWDISSLLNDPRFPDQPDLTTFVTSFEAPRNIADDYAQRISGFVVPPLSGEYRFYLSADDVAALFLSPDDDPANETQIAFEPSWHNVRDWTNTQDRPNSENISVPIWLEAGRRYSIEVLHKEGGGGDHVEVTWQLPGAPVPVGGSAPIPGEYLEFFAGSAPPDFPPTISIPNQTLYVGQTTELRFSAGTGLRRFEIASVTAVSSDQSVVPNANITVNGSGFYRSLQLTPAGPGMATISVVTTYLDNTSAIATFMLTALPIGPQNLVIEAEDFDTGGGQHVSEADNMPYLGGKYEGLGAVHQVDYFGSSEDPIADSNNYRDGETPNVGMTMSFDTQRPGYTATVDYKVGWNSDGDWYNYTRNIPPATYNVYARLASGGADEHASLSLVTSGFGTSSQTTASLGTFDAPATGGWDTFAFVPLKNGAGDLASVPLGGLQTLRFAVLPGSLDFNYLLLVPISRTPVVSWNSPAQITCGLPLGAAELNATADVPGTFTYNPPTGTVLPPGSYTLTSTFTPSDSAQYSSVTLTRTIDVVSVLSGINNIDPNSALAGSGDFTLTVNGLCFTPGSEVLWNGSLRAATFISDTQLTASISAADVLGSANIVTLLVQVLHPNGSVSNPQSFTILPTSVSSAQTSAAEPGQSATISTAPTTSGQAGVTATIQNNGSGPVAATVANYSSNPSGTAFSSGGQYTDLQVTGADASTTAAVSFYYPSTLDSATEAALTLVYFDGVAWITVRSDGDTAPIKDLTDNLDGSVSGGRFTVVFSDTSTPKITDLHGTYFAVGKEPIAFTGFLPPIGGADQSGGTSQSPVRTFKMGSTIPVKFTARYAGAPVLNGTHTLKALKYSSSTTAGTAIDAAPQGAASQGNQFRVSDGQWIFNLDTKATGMSTGIWQLIATLSDGTQHKAWIQLK